MERERLMIVESCRSHVLEEVVVGIGSEKTRCSHVSIWGEFACVLVARDPVVGV